MDGFKLRKIGLVIGKCQQLEKVEYDQECHNHTLQKSAQLHRLDRILIYDLYMVSKDCISKKLCIVCLYRLITVDVLRDGPHSQGFSYLSEVRARGLLNLGEKHLDHQNWENLMQPKRTGF